MQVEALTDEDFNNKDGSEGSGTDELLVACGLDGYSGKITAIVKVYYQTVSAKWLEEMFALSSPEIDQWKSIYNNSIRQPVLIASATTISETN